MRIQYKNMQNSIKTKEVKTLRVLNKFDIDWLVAFYKAKCTVQWADEHIRKLSIDSVQAPTLTAGTQIETSYTGVEEISEKAYPSIFLEKFWYSNIT